MSRARFASLTILLVILAGCSRAQKEASQQQAQPATEQKTPPPPQAATPEAPATPRAEPPPAASAAPAHRAPQPQSGADRSVPATKSGPAQQAAAGNPSPAPRAEPPVAVPPPPPQPKYAVVPSGQKIEVRLQDPLDTGINRQGDKFRAILDRDLVVDGNVIAPRGSVVQGKLPHLERSARVQGRAQMSLELMELRIEEESYPIQTNLLSFESESTKKQDAEKVGIGAGIGAVIGAIAGGGKGAAIGAAAGAGAGGATVIATRGKELKFEPEHRFTFTLRRDLQVKLR